MSVKNIDLGTVAYIPVTDDKDIIIEVKIGNAGDEEGSYAVFLGKVFIDANAPANMGKKADVSGQKATVSVTIVDELEETNWTSMTVIIREGNHEIAFGPYSEEVDEQNDTINYILKIAYS